MRNLTFAELDSFIDDQFCDIHQWVHTFHLQAPEVDKFMQNISGNGEKLNEIGKKLNLLSDYQNEICCKINWIDCNLEKLENLVTCVEKNLKGVKYVIPVDQERQRIYKNCDNIFTCLHNCEEMLEMVGCQVQQNEVLNGPLEKVSQILKQHLQALESVEMKLAHMKNCLHVVDGAKNKLLRTCAKKFAKH